MRNGVQPRRIKSLDGLRGIAALIVVFHHCLLTLPSFDTQGLDIHASSFWTNPVSYFKFSPLRLLVIGKPCVLVFFVLSGFVLSLPLLQTVDHVAIAPYVWKRLVRLWPPFAVAILLSAIFYILSPPLGGGVSRTVEASSWNVPLSLSVLTEHLLMLGTKNSTMLDGPVWSLVHELRIALVFVFLLRAVRYSPVRSTLILWSVGILATMQSDRFSSVVLQTWLATLSYVCLFAAGCALAIKLDVLARVFARMTSRLRASLLLMILMVLMAPSNKMVQIVAVAPAAVVCVALAAADTRVASLLRATVPQWLGKVSYSLYLTHFPILLCVMAWLPGHQSAAHAVLIGLPLSLVVAELFFRYVEGPFMALSRGRRSQQAQSVQEQLAHSNDTPL